jgi:hypothetical protein
MQPIRVEPVPGKPQCHVSAAAAIAESGNRTELWRRKTGIASCLGQPIERVEWNVDRVVIHVASGGLTIGCDEEGVVCELAKREDVSGFDRSGVADEEIELHFGNAAVTFHPGLLASRLAGATLVNIQLSDGALFFYSSNQPILCFGVLRNLSTDRLFLYCCESE